MTTKNAQKYRHGRCVHCLIISDEINDDHIFPTAWYPDDTPATVERWTVPSCVKCNAEQGKNEQDLLIKLGLCISPNDARASGVADKALRSIKPGAGKNPRDRDARQAKRKQVIKDIELHKIPPTAGVLPNFGQNPSIHYPGFMTVKIPEEGLITLGRKIVRGLTYHFEHRFIEDDKEEVLVSFLHDKDAKDFAEVVKRFGQTFHKGPGITVARAVMQDGSNAGLFVAEIWGRLKIYASLLPREPAAK